MTAAQLLSMMNRRRERLSDMAKLMSRLPQVMENVTVKNESKSLLDTDGEILNAVKNAEQALGESGRILVRASGTEPLIRVMVEGDDHEAIDKIAKDVAGVIKERLS